MFSSLILGIVYSVDYPGLRWKVRASCASHTSVRRLTLTFLFSFPACAALADTGSFLRVNRAGSHRPTRFLRPRSWEVCAASIYIL
jgi:hypothetical protein